MSLPPPLRPRDLLSTHGLGPKKSFGQNFLHDLSVLETAVRAIGVKPGQPVLELGAGLGALTHALLSAGAEVIAIERDRDLVPILREHFGGVGTLSIREGDAGALNYRELSEEVGAALHVAGNLPYNLSSRILVNLADAGDYVQRSVVMVQREVAERLVAGPGSRIYGLLSVLVGRAFASRILRVVPPGAFFPAPKVHSALVLLERHPHRLPTEVQARLVRVARAAFSKRRKTIRNALKTGLNIESEALLAALQAANIEAGARAEELSIEDFAHLGEALLG